MIYSLFAVNSPARDITKANTFIANTSRSMIKHSWIAKRPTQPINKKMNPMVYKTCVAMKNAVKQKDNFSLGFK